ncbi:hypothetical protein ACIFOC_00451 [Leucobacter aridicollis]|uniref:Phage capsid-like C-terminal domain-containing protein n=1 Tax=Leucobacter aridicollis TaxID=283878 RepID=A0A852RB17_9MICO|nr:phage major capsid protein [Leucobacter aridicollis]MBL3682658.1 phage major capsid protein [Leucobacter aridicollis]NYD26090.1 hypothetical protein [Leucobacter aridicollis]
MAVFGTGDLKNLPRTIADGLVKDTVGGSTIAALSGSEPMRFGNVDIITFNGLPRAEFVGEGDQKGHTTGSFGSVTAKPRKAQVTMRFNEEVQWADEDHQLGVLSELAKAGGEALARALDLGVYHRLNPLTGAAITGWDNYLNATTKRVEVADKPDLEVEQAIGLLVNDSKTVNGIAFDPSFAWTLATARYADGRKKNPELGIGVNLSSYEGLTASVSDTVSGRPEAGGETPTDLKTRAIAGDFRGGIRWGVQRNIPIEMIKHGDPDGQGDLKRKNQIALRLEIVYGWHVFADRFAVVETA